MCVWITYVEKLFIQYFFFFFVLLNVEKHFTSLQIIFHFFCLIFPTFICYEVVVHKRIFIQISTSWRIHIWTFSHILLSIFFIQQKSENWQICWLFYFHFCGFLKYEKKEEVEYVSQQCSFKMHFHRTLKIYQFFFALFLVIFLLTKCTNHKYFTRFHIFFF